jgi:hypothetical protein
MTTTSLTTASPGLTDRAVAERLAGDLIRFLETNEPPVSLFADGLFLDFTLPQWRLQAQSRDEAVAVRRAGHPAVGRVPRSRLDLTETGFLLEVEEEWDDQGQHWYCRELMRCDVADGKVTQISVYCTGDWDEATVAAHRDEVTLSRP